MLSNLETDTGNAGLQLRACYDALRDEVLAAHPWNFALDLQALTAESPPPAFGFAQRFKIPQGNPLWLRPWALDERTYPLGTPWQHVGDFVHTDEEAPLLMVGIKQVTDASRFSPHFVNAFAHRLAIQIGPTLGASDALIDGLKKAYEALLGSGRSVNGQTGQPGPPEDGEFLGSRA